MCEGRGVCEERNACEGKGACEGGLCLEECGLKERCEESGRMRVGNGT